MLGLELVVGVLQPKFWNGMQLATGGAAAIVIGRHLVINRSIISLQGLVDGTDGDTTMVPVEM